MIRLTGGTLEPYSDHDFDESKHNIVIKADAKAKLQALFCHFTPGFQL